MTTKRPPVQRARGVHRRRARGARGLAWLAAVLCAWSCSAPPRRSAELAAQRSEPPAPAASALAQRAEPAPRFEALAEDEAWKLWPRAQPPLPIWARSFAAALPRTIAAQLDLDALQRARSPLGNALAARVAWVVADALRCDYARARARADLERAGLAADALAHLGDFSALPRAEALALEFARALTLRGSSIPDEQVAQLIETLGADDSVALVHAVAFANFEDRLFLALGLRADSEAFEAPLEIGAATLAAAQAPARAALPAPGAESERAPAAQAAWSARTPEQLREQLECQKARAPRIALPDAARLARLPRPERERVAGTTWGKVSMGYQPALTSAWFRTMGSFEREAQLDEVFANSVFWVVTRTNDCFY